LLRLDREKKNGDDDDKIQKEKISNFFYKIDLHSSNDLDEDCLVYPMSIIYDKNADKRKKIIKYTFLALLFILLILFLVFSTTPFRTFSVRLGYFADKITKETISLSEASEISIHTRDCIVYLLENTDSRDEIELYVSAPRITNIATPKEGTVQYINVLSELNSVMCYVEIKIPGGVNIPKLSFKLEGDKIPDLMIYDYKDDSTWNNPMLIDELNFDIIESYPNVLFKNQHQVANLNVQGSYCVCNFEKLKIQKMKFAVTLGSFSVIQNSMYSVNKMTVKTPKGTHWVAGKTVNTADSSWPSKETRNAGISGSFIDTSSYCTSELYVCSDSASSCPSSGATVTSSQGDFTVTLDDGPIQFLIDGSSTSAYSTYIPTLDTFAITSQKTLTDNKEDFNTEPQDPRIYLYEVISPGYSKMWTHSSLKQYIEARPWLISFLSLNLLKPTFYRDTLIHIPGGACPFADSSSVKTNTLISEKIKALSFIESGHLVSAKEDNTYYRFILTAENDYIKREIIFLGDNILIWICLIISFFIGIYSVYVVGDIFLNMFRGLSNYYKKYLDDARKLSKTKKINSKSELINDLTAESKSNSTTENKILTIGCFSCSDSEEVNLEKQKESEELSLFKKTRELTTIDLSFYKIIDICIDYYIRTSKNSLQIFISSINENEANTKLDDQVDGYNEDMWVRLDIFTVKYHDFCTKYGFKIKEITTNQGVMKKNDLKFENRGDSVTDVYTKIRWKTHFEKTKKMLSEIKSEK
jgi:hypothetical protein